MKAKFKPNKKFFPPAKNFSEGKNNREEYKTANDSELLTVSKEIIERNKNVYAELAK